MTYDRWRHYATGVGAGAILALSLAGCAKKDRVESTPPPASAPSGPRPAIASDGKSPQEHYELALAALQQGNEAQARAELRVFLAMRQGDRRGSLLIRQIDTDPKELYGADSFLYTVRAGDTLFSLARRFLGNPLNFYGLARFNGLALPVDLKPGQTISIPGRVRTRPAPSPRRPAPSAGANPATPPVAEEPARTAAPASKGNAQRLRQQGLEQMTAGSIDRAVALLSRATSLDPGNEAIAADLARARRIQATVHGK